MNINQIFSTRQLKGGLAAILNAVMKACHVCCISWHLSELLSRLLNSAFEGYDLENMITAFLLARQGALEGPGIFPTYSDWFKVSLQLKHQLIAY